MIDQYKNCFTLGSLLERVAPYKLIAHWTQGEFHHDIVVELLNNKELLGNILVIATNCNGGVKECLCFGEVPDRNALWHYRCPRIPEFTGTLPPILESYITLHWFDPSELLVADARSELKPNCRERQSGGGWVCKV
jgi:hypothetical protein